MPQVFAILRYLLAHPLADDLVAAYLEYKPPLEAGAPIGSGVTTPPEQAEFIVRMMGGKKLSISQMPLNARIALGYFSQADADKLKPTVH
jgi:hypothetical protein